MSDPSDHDAPIRVITMERSARSRWGVFRTPGACPKPYDSKLEERFARDFARIAPDWDLVREPEPLAVDGTFVFPDFALVDRRDGSRRWLIEIVGFWTPEYLATKLERLRRAGRHDLILCIDEKLGCNQEAAAPHAAVLSFRGRVDAHAVKRIVDGASATPIVSAPSVGVRPRRAAPIAEATAAAAAAPAAPAPAPAVVPEPRRTERLGLAHFFLDYAGRRPPDDPIHVRLRSLRPGDLVSLRPTGTWLQVVHDDGTPIAALSGNGRAAWTPRLAAIRAVRVLTMVERGPLQSAPAYRAHLRVDRWLVPLLEVEMTPQDDAGGSSTGKDEFR